MVKRSDYKWEKQYQPNTVIKDLDYDFFDGSVENLIRKLNQFIADYPEYHDLKIDMNYNYDTYDFTLRGSRYETDEEFASRIQYQEEVLERQKTKEAKKKDKEYKEYMRLKKKFEV